MSRAIAILAALASAPTSSSAFVVAPWKAAASVPTMPSHLQVATVAESFNENWSEAETAGHSRKKHEKIMNDLDEWIEEAPKTLRNFVPTVPSRLQATVSESFIENWSEAETAALNTPARNEIPQTALQQTSANKKKPSKSHQEGIFSPVVLAVKALLTSLIKLLVKKNGGESFHKNSQFKYTLNIN
jgi:uncharacterized protein with von Willebrand factor type A (vWA) domain